MQDGGQATTLWKRSLSLRAMRSSRLLLAKSPKRQRNPEFASSQYELAIAIARSSLKIDGPYQDVLSWATQLGDARTFIDRINRHGSANDDMRNFVNTFRKHLEDAGVAQDEETVWLRLT
jgi:hypothetical protein